jgi:hypothetical protein
MRRKMSALRVMIFIVGDSDILSLPFTPKIFER